MCGGGGGGVAACNFPSTHWCHFELGKETGDGGWETEITRILGPWKELKGTSYKSAVFIPV